MKQNTFILISGLLVSVAAGAFTQTPNPPEYTPLPRLPAGISTTPQSDQRPAPIFQPLPRLQTGEPPAERSAAMLAKMRTADQQLWQSLTNAAFQTQLQQTLTLLKLANQQPGVRAKVEAARREVQDYLRQHSPELMPVFEKLKAPRELQRQEGQLTELIY